MEQPLEAKYFSVSRKRWYKKPLFYVFLIIIIAVGYLAYQFGSAYGTIVIDNGDGFFNNITRAIFGLKQETPNPNDVQYPMPSPEPDRLDVLILGIRGTSKQEIEEEGGLLTDTIQVISVDKKNNKASIVSLPRDLYIDLSGVHGKINEAYERGLAKGTGLSLVKEVVSKITGVYIDKAIVFDFNAFQHIVDSIGGIDINLAKPFEESSQWGYEFKLPAGQNHLNGEQALYYVRSRYSTSDFDRAKRQQEVVSAIKNKAAQEGYFSNVLKITSMLNEVKNDIRTDFQIWDISDLMNVASHFSSDSQIKDYVIDTTNLVYESKGSQNEYILLPVGDNYEGIYRLFQNLITQNIKNSSPTPLKSSLPSTTPAVNKP